MKKVCLAVLPALTIVLELLPLGAVCIFATSPTERVKETFSYFSLTPFGYANFAPLITATLTVAIFLLSLFSLKKKGVLKGLFAYAFAGRDITGKSIEDIVYEAQRKVVLELAGKEPCVIVGRNADYILRDRDDVLNVFIHGDMPEKTQRIMGLYNVEEKEAVKMMADTDKRRMTNYNFYTEQKWGKASNYTLCLNSSQLGYDRCEKIIMECSK